jgi:FKBP-type peptidyl-prolyl cis-trans isomerase
MKKSIIAAFVCIISVSMGISASASDTLVTASGIKYVRIKEGDGIHPLPGQSVKVIYSRKSSTGRVVESNEGSKPFKFQVDNHEVIPGWDQAVKLMSKGEKWYCIIPSELGYGKKGVEGVIAPNATLYFYIEIVDIK